MKRLSLAIMVIGLVFLTLSFNCNKVPLSLVEADALVLLAGNIKERGPTAAALIRDGVAERILLTNDGVFSSWSPQYRRNLYGVEWTEEYLVGASVPREKIVKLPFYASATMYDALAVKRYDDAHPMHRLIIITTDYHTPRAMWAFRKAFAGKGPALRAIGVPTYRLHRMKGKVLELVKMAVYLTKYSFFGRPPVLGAPIPTFPLDQHIAAAGAGSASQ